MSDVFVTNGAAPGGPADRGAWPSVRWRQVARCVVAILIVIIDAFLS